MSKRTVKYNPAFLSGEELVANFVVRHAELDLIMQVVRENTGPANQHLLVIGPRGIGKTMLVLRAMEEVRRCTNLVKMWYPLVFSEESYVVTNAGEFWLEALFYLGQQTDNERWQAAFQELKLENDPTRLRERALAQLMDFADTEHKRVLLVVENLNMLLGNQMSDEEGWVLRHTLLNESRIMLLATATSRFEQIDNTDKPMFELFRTIEPEPLDDEECLRMWTCFSGTEPPDNGISPIRILTGGNPRLVSVISTFGARLSFKELMDDLMQLVDDHTEYFKSHLDNLPPIERKVYLALVELWAPAAAREVAENARLEVSKVSSLLRRLRERGAVVEVEGQGPRKKFYQVAERLYNIYYLMRRHGAPSQRVKAVVNFMLAFYGKQQLLDTVREIALEACRLENNMRLDHFLVYEQILTCSPSDSLRNQIRQETPLEFLNAPDTPISLRNLVTPGQVDGAVEPPSSVEGLSEQATLELGEAKVLFSKGVNLLKQREYTQAVAAYDELVSHFGAASEIEIKVLVACVLVSKGVALGEQKEYAQAVAAYNEVVSRFGAAREIDLKVQVARALIYKGFALDAQKEYCQVVAAFDEVISRFGATPESELKVIVARAMVNKGVALGDQKEYSQAIATFSEVVSRFGAAPEIELKVQVAGALFNKGFALVDQKGYSQAVATFDEVVSRFGVATEIELKVLVARALVNKGFTLGEQKEYPQAIATYDEVISRFVAAPEIELKVRVARALVNRGVALGGLKEYSQAVATYDKVVSRFGAAPEIELKLQVARALVEKSDVLFVQKEYVEAASIWNKAKKMANKLPKGNELLNSLAWILYRYRIWDMLPKAVCCAQKAVSLRPEDSNYRHTLASVLYLSGKGTEALEEGEAYLADRDVVENSIDDAIDLFVGLAATGYADEASRLLQKSPNADLLEPLVVGLRLYLGEEAKSAAEIMEVAGDVVQRIEERRNELESRGLK